MNEEESERVIWGVNPPPPGTSELPEVPEVPGTSLQWPPPHRKALPSNLDPYIKNPEYERYQKRSRSPEYRHRRPHRSTKRRSRSRSAEYERHRSRRTTRRRRTSSSSRSRSNSAERTRKRSRSRSGSNEEQKRSVAYRRSHTSRYKRSKSPMKQQTVTQEDVEEEEEPQTKENAFKNDGSFMEMFKKMQEEKHKQEIQKKVKEEAEIDPLIAATGSVPVNRLFPSIGKRRGGRILKTGIVAKPKLESENPANQPQDAWSIYLKEVKRYKEACCDDDSKTRPLVK